MEGFVILFLYNQEGKIESGMDRSDVEFLENLDGLGLGFQFIENVVLFCHQSQLVLGVVSP